MRIAKETLVANVHKVSLPVPTARLFANPPPSLAAYLGAGKKNKKAFLFKSFVKNSWLRK